MSEPELLALCHRLLREGVPERIPTTLDTDHPFLPLAVDIAGDVAAAAVAAMPPVARVGRPVMRIRRFHRVAGQWVSPGGGGNSLRPYPLTLRLPAAEQQGVYVRHTGLGRTSRNPDRGPAEPAAWIHNAVVHAAAEVTRLHVADRVLPLQFHGHAVIVWSTDTAPTLLAHDGDDRLLATLDLNELGHRLPAHDGF